MRCYRRWQQTFCPTPAWHLHAARIEEANLEVATAQLEVANLRFEKGLIDNFSVVDSSAGLAGALIGNDARIIKLAREPGFNQ